MAKFMNFNILLGIIITLSNLIYAKPKTKIIDRSYNTSDIIISNAIDDSDNYYVIYVNNINSNVTTSSFEKRQEENDQFINSLVNEINNLIIGNKDTYENPDILDEFETSHAQLRKRSTTDGDDKNENDSDSNLVYPIFEDYNQTALYAYLSSDLVDIINSMPNVSSCVKDFKFEPQSFYDLNTIKNETGWENVSIKFDSNLNLSLLSQGKTDRHLIDFDGLDLNYYYPTSAGKDTDVYIFDSGFNFNYDEFSNTKDRIAKCLIRIDKGEIIEHYKDGNCPTENLEEYFHGEMVSDVVGGIRNGVSENANIYGIALNSYNFTNVYVGLKYIQENMFRPHKTVINFSFGGYLHIDEHTQRLETLIHEMTEQGAVFVAAAGNYGAPVSLLKNTDNNDNNNDNSKIAYFFPCYYDDVICVGGTYYGTFMDPIYEIDSNSNFGKGVDIFAPYFTDVEFIANDEICSERGYGTSGSSPLVAGVAASIISEYPKIKFDSKSMLDFLYRLALKNVIVDTYGAPNAFLNNGKRIVYSKNEIYIGCGINAGNQKCPNGQCCSAEGICTSDETKCKLSSGCQPQSGFCEIDYTTDPKKRCGLNYGKCKEGFCCSSKGYCGQSFGHCGVGCQPNFGLCY